MEAKEVSRIEVKNDKIPEALHQASERSELAKVLRELINLLLENLLKIEKNH